MNLKARNYDLIVQAERHQLAVNQIRQQIQKNQQKIFRLERKELNKPKTRKKHGGK